VWSHAIESLGTIAVPGKWSVVLALHCSRTIATCLHALQALSALPAHVSCRPMMALMLGALKTCVRALGTCVPSCIGRPARLFFIIKDCCPQGAMGDVQCRSPPQSGAEVRSHRTSGSAEAHLSREAGSGVIGHVAAPEPTLAERRGPEP
jgi:hypothetical protein